MRDFGTDTSEPIDYPDVVVPAARAVARGEADRAIVFGGSGNGEAMAANKIRGIRAALCHDVSTARLSRQHNDANVLTIGARVVDPNLALEIVREWLDTTYEGEARHARRIQKIAELEKRFQ